MNLVKYPNKILSERIKEFDFSNPLYDPIKLEKNMIDIMFRENGIGLAANQIGISARVFVMGHKDNPDLAQAFFNPIILAHVDELNDAEEGCLSFPGIFVNIKRPKKIKAKWQNAKGEWQEGTFEGYDCKCFLHELDHLEGITFKDRISALKWALAVKKTKKTKR